MLQLIWISLQKPFDFAHLLNDSVLLPCAQCSSPFRTCTDLYSSVKKTAVSMRNLLLGSLFPNPVTGTEATLIASHVLKSGGYVYNVYILCLFIEGDFLPFGKYVYLFQPL